MIRARLAIAADEGGLRRLLAKPVGGGLALAYERPAGIRRTLGPKDRLVSVLRDGKIEGMAARFIRQAWVNGRKAPVASLSLLRVDEESPEPLALLSAGASLLREIQRREPAHFTLATLMSEDSRPARLLESGRLGLPRPQWRDRLVTLSFGTRPGKAQPGPMPAWPGVRHFLEQGLRQFQFAALPLHRSASWVAVESGGRLSALAAIVDERGDKQIRVSRLPWLWKLGRPLINAAMPRAMGWPRLPPEGACLQSAGLACFHAADADSALRLLDLALGQAHAAGIEALNLCLSEGHPLLAPLRREAGGLAVRSRLALLRWDGNNRPALDGRPAFVDVTSL